MYAFSPLLPSLHMVSEPEARTEAAPLPLLLSSFYQRMGHKDWVNVAREDERLG